MTYLDQTQVFSVRQRERIVIVLFFSFLQTCLYHFHFPGSLRPSKKNETRFVNDCKCCKNLLLNPVNLDGYREKESEQTAGVQMNFIENETDFNSLLYKKGQCKWVHRAMWSTSKELIPASVALSEWEYFYSSPGWMQNLSTGISQTH